MNRRNLALMARLVASVAVTTTSGLAQGPPPTANFDANPKAGPAPLAVQFTDQSTGNISSWDWNFDDGSAHSPEQNPSHTYNIPGDRTVSLTVSGPGGSSRKSLLIYPFSSQWWFRADFTANPTSGTAPLRVQFTDQSSGLFSSRDWNFGDGSAHSAEVNPLHTYTNAGDYTITLTISGPGGGSHSKSGTIHVTAPPPPAVLYTLLKGSQLGLSMPCCPPPPQSFVMSGTFRLKLLDSSDPLVTRYQLTNVSFTAIAYGGNYRRLTGEGTYQVGGKDALLQEMSLALQIDGGPTNKLSFFTNYDYSRAVQDAWPRIGVSAFQANGTDWEEYSMAIVAAPAPRLLSVMPDAQTGNVRLQWQAYDAVQLDRATAVTGPYSPVATNLTSQSFVDVGALTNQSQLYYRLRQD
ncbi:MAG TPA: PKD domain-containing protein [Verrucomicrobiae bacterium]|nr:PKD domain-containing protein [Verrucomicrobiae bacterium]